MKALSMAALGLLLVIIIVVSALGAYKEHFQNPPNCKLVHTGPSSTGIGECDDYQGCYLASKSGSTYDSKCYSANIGTDNMCACVVDGVTGQADQDACTRCQFCEWNGTSCVKKGGPVNPDKSDCNNAA